jgi:hypothetical protein
MPQGLFNLTKYHAGKLRQEDFENAQKKGRLLQLLATLKERGRWHGQPNLVGPSWAGHCFYYDGFGGANLDNPTYLDDGPFNIQAALANITLVTDDTEPAYNDAEFRTNYSVTIHNGLDSVNTASAGKRFLEDDAIAHEIDKPGDGREAIYFKSLWGYWPGQGTTDPLTDKYISGIRVFYCYDGDTTGGTSRVILARVLLKDVNDNPAYIVKENDEVLMVEYTFTLVSH